MGYSSGSADAQAVHAEVLEAGDAVGSLPQAAVSAAVHAANVSALGLDDGDHNSHVRLQKSLPQVPVNNVDLDTRVGAEPRRGGDRGREGCAADAPVHQHNSMRSQVLCVPTLA